MVSTWGPLLAGLAVFTTEVEDSSIRHRVLKMTSLAGP
jgi:hypothetical protein